MEIYDLSQELLGMFVSFFNDVLSPFRMKFEELPFPSFIQDFVDFLMNMFGFNISQTSLLAFMFGTGMFVILGVTIWKWVIDLIP